MLENNIGYIRITTFDMQTAEDFDVAYSDLKSQGMKGLVIDLRYNPGGIIDSTVAITDKFLRCKVLLHIPKQKLEKWNITKLMLIKMIYL